MRFFRNSRPALIILLFGLAVIFPIQAYAYPYNVTVDYSVASSPQGVVVADLNNDGRDDVAVVRYAAGRVSVLLNACHGLLGTAANYSVGNAPWGIVAADFDGDGYKDLVVSNSADNQISFLNNNGDGTFAAAVNYGTGRMPQGLAFGDFDGDDEQDIVVANMDDDTFSILRGVGDGTFSVKADFSAGVDPAMIIAEDFDNDNKQDVAVADSGAGLIVAYNAGGVSILTGRGDGTFNARQYFPAAKGVTSIASGDFNGDGDKDVAAAIRNTGQIGIFTGRGDGTLNTVVNYSVGTYPMSVALFDINADGELDIVAANSGADTLSFYEGVGDGTFTNHTTAAAGTQPVFIATGDINQDGKTDLAISNRTANTVRTYLDNSAPTISSLSPGSAYAGSGDTEVIINGSGFEPDAGVEVGGVSYATTFVDTNQVRFQLSSSDLANIGDLEIEVYNPAISVHSDSSVFTISTAPPASGGLPRVAFVAPNAPENGFKVIINDGAQATSNRNVSLKFVTQPAGDPVATKFTVSNDPNFTNAFINDLAIINGEGYLWNICSNSTDALSQTCIGGEHIVYVKFYSSWGRSSPVVTSKINYSSVGASAPSVPEMSVSAPSSYVFTRNLKKGDVDSDVKKLQELLNSKGFVVSQSGPGSSGYETNYFGAKTETAVKLFQEAHVVEILAPLGLASGTGYFGTATRQYANSIMQ
jgi:predicted NUDIX family NTP pyrophosphohydrolase